MKTSSVHTTRFPFWPASPVVLGLAVFLFSHRGALAAGEESVSSLPALPRTIQQQLGRVVVIASPNPARFSYQPGAGRARYAADGAEEAARTMLDFGVDDASIPDPLLSIVPTVLAPFTAAAGALVAREYTLSEGQLREAETDLKVAAEPLCVQEGWPDLLVQAAREQLLQWWTSASLQGPLSPGSPEFRRLSGSGFKTAVQLELTELRLEQTGRSDTSYALLMGGRLKLFRTRDGAVLYSEPVTYRSGKGLFVDWTLNGAQSLTEVVERGRRRIVDQVMQNVFLPSETVAPRARDAGKAKRPRLQVTAPPLRPEIVANLGCVGVIATSTIPTRIQLQYPLTKDQGADYARHCAQQIVAADAADLDRVLANPILGAIATAAIIPTSVAGQTVNGFRGLTVAQLNATAQTLDTLVNGINLQEALRENVASRVQSLTAQPTRLVQKALPLGNAAECAQMSCFMAGTLAWIPDHQTPAYYLRNQNVDTALEIAVRNPRLCGADVVNPALALHLEARATLIRVETMDAIYSVSVRYDGGARQFAQWAAHDGAAFRREIESCVQLVSAALVDHLAVPAWTQSPPIELVNQPANRTRGFVAWP